MSGNIDMESSEKSLCSMMMHEDPRLRWSFIRKVYSIIIFQFLLTIVVASIVIFVDPVANFFNNTTQGYVVYIVLIFVPFITICPLFYYHEKHPHNYFLLLVFNVTSALPVGLTCAFARTIILEVFILVTVIVFSMTLYTFWAAKRGHNFSYLRSFLFRSLLVVVLLGLIQIVFPMEKLSNKIHESFVSIIFCGYIVYDTNYLIKKFTYDQHIRAFVFLYLDVINLFLPLFIYYF